LLHHNAFDLIALALIERLIRAPRPVHLQMVLGQRRSDLLELADHPPQSVARLAPRHQDRIRGGDDDHIVDAEQGNELFLRGDVGAARVDEDSRTMCGVLSGFVRRQFPDRRRPTSRTRPASRSHERCAPILRGRSLSPRWKRFGVSFSPAASGKALKSIRQTVRHWALHQREVWEAYKRVRANKGMAGVDEQSIADFEADLTNNLYKLRCRTIRFLIVLNEPFLRDRVQKCG
jgi:hypothetical protein